MRYRSCKNLEYNYAFFHGNFDLGENIVTYCCADEAPNISVTLCDDPAETIRNYMDKRRCIIEESMHYAQLGIDPPAEERGFSAACSRCAGFYEDEWPGGESRLFMQVNFGQRPTPCQSKCIYCSQNLENRRKFDKKLDSRYHELILETVEYALQNDIISDTALWEVASGEIAVHPYKKRIYDIIGVRTTAWLTNCFIYEQPIADNLHANPYSHILFSMDAGTPGTWLKIKGIDNFEKVMDNLVRYYASITRSNQIVLKYIMLPGINDNIGDFASFIEIAKVLESDRVILSRNRWAQDCDAHIEGCSTFIAMLAQNNIEPVLQLFSNEERLAIIAKAEKLLAGC